MKDKGGLLLSIGEIKPKKGEKKEDESGDYDEEREEMLDASAEEVLAAIKAGDKELLKEALFGFVNYC